MEQVGEVLCAVPGGCEGMSGLLGEAVGEMHRFCSMDSGWAGMFTISLFLFPSLLSWLSSRLSEMDVSEKGYTYTRQD